MKYIKYKYKLKLYFITWLPGAAEVKNMLADAGGETDAGSIPRLGRSPGVRNGTHSSILAREILCTEEPEGL